MKRMIRMAMVVGVAGLSMLDTGCMPMGGMMPAAMSAAGSAAGVLGGRTPGSPPAPAQTAVATQQAPGPTQQGSLYTPWWQNPSLAPNFGSTQSPSGPWPAPVGNGTLAGTESAIFQQDEPQGGWMNGPGPGYISGLG